MNATPSHPSHTFRAMGSQIGLWLDAAPETAAAAFAQVEALFAFNEQVLSRFLPESELCRLNGRAGEWVSVSDLLWNVLCDAVLQAEATQGLFDPTLLNALEAAGYDRSFDLMAAAGTQINADDADKNWENWRQVGLDVDTQSVWLPPGMRLDLGGIGKGFTAQEAVERLSQWGPCLVDAGGDVTAGAAPHGWPGWPVAVAAPWTEEAPEQANLLTLWLAESSLATSGIDYRRWQVDGRTAHHLIDPRTGQPAQTDILTVTVWAEQATTAEAWATAVLVQGSLSGWQALHQQPNLAGVIITQNEHLLITESLQGLIA